MSPFIARFDAQPRRPTFVVQKTRPAWVMRSNCRWMAEKLSCTTGLVRDSSGIICPLPTTRWFRTSTYRASWANNCSLSEFLLRSRLSMSASHQPCCSFNMILDVCCSPDMILDELDRDTISVISLTVRKACARRSMLDWSPSGQYDSEAIVDTSSAFMPWAMSSDSWISPLLSANLDAAYGLPDAADESKGNHPRLQSGTHDGKSLRPKSSRSPGWIRPCQCNSQIHDKRIIYHFAMQ